MNVIPICAEAHDAKIVDLWSDVHEKTKELTGVEMEHLRIVETVIKKDGTYIVLACDGWNEGDAAYIYHIDYEGNLLNVLKLKRELPLVGGIGIDDEENMYVAYGTELEEGQDDETVLRLVKYDEYGEKLAVYDVKGRNGDSTLDTIKIAFSFGSCDININNGIVTCLFAREMFQSDDGLNHQASFSFAVNAENLETVSNNITYCSHSFEQTIYYDGSDFIFMDTGDAYPRGFLLSKVDGKTAEEQKVCVPMKFKLGPGGLEHDTDRIDYNYTFSELGGITKLKNQYLFFGTYENKTENPNLYSSRNLFTQMISLDLEDFESPCYQTDYVDIDEGNQSMSEMLGVHNPAGFEIGKYYGILYDVKKDNDITREMIFLDENGDNVGRTKIHKNRQSELANDVFYYIKIQTIFNYLFITS